MLSDNTRTRLEGLSRMIGNTPMLVIDFLYKGEPRSIYAKAEHFNLTGSIKDRMALHIFKRAYSEGRLAPSAPIAEATSGNTGIAFACIGRALGHPVTIFMPNWMSQERKMLIHSLGADIRLVTPEEGGFLGSIRLSEEMAQSNKQCFLPKQFANEDNANAHATTTAPEIWEQLSWLGLRPDGFVAGVGTGGTVMGVGRYLKAQNKNIQVYPLEPANSPTMSTGGKKIGKHRIQGISDEFIPALAKLDELDEIVSVDDGDSIIMAQKLANELGLAVGVSSGANFLGALMAQEKLGGDACIATIFSDCNKKYLSTDLMKQEPVKPNFLSTHVKLTGFRVIRRAW